MPCRSASGSLAKARRYWSLSPTSPRHRVRTRTIHADFAVVIDGHERKRRIELRVDDVDVEIVDVVDRFPVRQRRAAERIDAELEVRGADRIHVDDVLQVFDIGQR